jgi:transporter family-2 protein
MNYLSPTLFALLLAGIAGAALPTQAGINSLLAKSWTGPLWAAFISFVIGAVALLVVLLSTKQTPPTISGFSKMEWWYFTGGLLGVFYVVAATFVAPIIGATRLVAMVIAGQLVVSVLLDHFGLFGFAKQTLDTQKVAGLLLMLLGVLLIKR